MKFAVTNAWNRTRLSLELSHLTEGLSDACICLSRHSQTYHKPSSSSSSRICIAPITEKRTIGATVKN